MPNTSQLNEMIHSLKESNALLQGFLDHFPGPAFIRDSQSRYLHLNPCFCSVFEHDGTWLGRTVWEIYPEDFAARIVDEDKKALDRGYHVYEKKLGLGEGGESVFEVHLFRIDLDDREPLVGGIAVDITQWYEAKNALKESESRYRTVFQNTGTATVIVDADKTIMLANNGFERLSGFSSEEVCGKIKWTEFVHPEDLDMMVAYHAKRRSQKRDAPNEYDFRFIDRKGEVRYVHLMVDLIQGTDRSVCSLTDITDCKRMQKELNRSVAKLETLLRTMPDMMFVLSAQGKYIDFWAENEEALAFPASDILDKGIEDLPLSSEKKSEIMEIIGRTLRERTVQSVDYQFDLKTGTEYYEARLSPYSESQVIAVIRDITARRIAEKEKHELQLRVQRAQKLESMGVLAGGIAHDFNNILMAILGNVDIAMMSIPETNPARQSMNEIVKAASTAAELARQMLDYSGKRHCEVRPYNLNELVLDLRHMLEVSVSRNVILKLRLADDLPLVMADAAQISQILMNLTTNASEAIGDSSGVISITTGAMYCDEEYLTTTELCNEIQPGLYVYMEISDTGCGMDRKTRAQVFEPFFTTKYTGRGLGLSSVLGIVRGHSGAIKIYTETGEGSTFKVLFPAIDPDEKENREEYQENQSNNWKGAGAVLIADDEDTVLAVGRRMLEHMGFEPLTAENGKRAVELFEEHADEIVLCVLDLTMPHLSGDEVYREIRRIREDIPVIISSGFSRKEVMHRFAGKRLAGFLQKPYRTRELSDVIRDVLAVNETTESE